MQKRIISILLSLFMILGTFSPLNLEVKAQDQLNDLKVEDNGEYVTIDITPMVKDAIEQNRWQYSKYSTMGTNSSNQPDTKITVNLVTVGLGGSEFRWDNVGMQPEDIVLTLERITSAGTSIDESYTNLFSNRKRKAEITIKNYVSGDKFFIKANATENITVSAVDRSGQLKQVNQDRPVDLLFIQIPNTKVTTKWVNAKGENLEEPLDLTANKGKFDFNFLNDTFSYKFDITNQDQEQHFKKDIRRALARKRLSLEKLNDSDNESIKFNNKTSGTYIKLNENTKEEKVVDFKTKYDPYKGGEITFIVKDKVYNKKPGEEVPEGYHEIAFNSGDGYFKEKDKKAEVIAYTVKDGTTWTDFKGLVKITDFPKVNHVNNLKLKNWTNSNGEVFTIADKTSETITSSMVFTAQFVELTDNNIQINLSGTGEQNAPRHGDKVVVGKTVKKGSDDVDPKSLSGKTVNIYKTIEAEPKKQLIGSGIVREDGSFTAAIHNDALKAGETIWAEIPTGKDKKISSEKYPTTVKLNPDELNKIIEIADKVLVNYKDKKFVKKDKYQALVDAVNGNKSVQPNIEGGKDLVETEGQNKGKLKIEEPKVQTNPAKTALKDGTDKQKRLDDAYARIKKAIEELTGNHIPVIKGPEHKEIFVGDTLDLNQDITVTDKDGEDDIVKDGQNKFTYTVKKVETTQQGTTETEVKKNDIASINNNAGTYKVTYTATDKSDATATHTMTLVVKEVEVTAIKVTQDPTVEQKYLVKDKDTKATPDYTGMEVELTYNNGTTKTATYDATSKKFKVGENEITELTVAPTEVGIADSPKVITATYEKGSTKLTDKAGKAIIVQVDSDGNGKADESEKFDITYATSFDIVSNPKLNYTVDSSTEKATLDLSALIVKVTDTKGNVKYYNWEDIKSEYKIKVTLTKTGEGEQAVEVSKTENTELTPKLPNTDEATKATKPFIENHNGAELKVVVDLVKVENGKVVYETDSTGAKTTKLERETDVNKTTKSAGTLSVLVDKDKNGKNDLEETTDKPFITSAKNVPTSPTDKTPKTVVKGHAKPGVKVEIKAIGDNGQPTGAVLGTVATVKDDGTYEVKLSPQQKAGTKVVAIATEGEKKPSAPSAPKAVIDDMDEDGNDDSKQGFNIAKATKIEFYEEPNLTYLVKEKTSEVEFNGKDADKKEISVRISYEENGKTLSNVFKLSELLVGNDKDKITVEPAIGETTKTSYNGEYEDNGNVKTTAKLVGKNLVVKLKKVVEKQGATEDQKTAATATSTSKFAIEIDADGNKIADKDETTPTPSILSARNVEQEKEGNKSINTIVKVKGEVGAKITIKSEDGKTELGTGIVGTNGEVEIKLNAKQDAGKKVQAIAKLGEKKDSKPAESIVFDDLNNDGKPDGQGNVDFNNIVDMRIASDPKTMNYALVSEDGTKDLDLSGLTVYVKDKNGNSGIYQYGAEANKVNGVQFEELKGDANFKLELVDAEGKNPVAIKDKATEKTTLKKANNNNKIKVSLVKTANKSDTTGPLNVFVDKNGNGIDDEKEKLDLTKVTGITIIKQPKLKYPITEKDGKAILDLSEMVVELTDGVNKAKYNAQELLDAKVGEGQAAKAAFKLEVVQPGATAQAADTVKSTITAVNGTELTTENDQDKVKITLASKADVNAKTDPLQVFEDLNKDGRPDKDETAPPTNVNALNVKEDKFTTITGTAKKGEVIKVYDKDGKELTTEQTRVTVTKDDGTFKLTINDNGNALAPNTPLSVTATDTQNNKLESTRVPVAVKTDKDGDGNADEGVKTIIKTLVARNIGTDGADGAKVPATFTTIEGKAEAGSTVTITFTESVTKDTTTVTTTADNEGNYKLELKENAISKGSQPILLPAGTLVKAKAKLGNKDFSDELKEKVIDDLNGDGIDDATQKSAPAKEVVAANQGTKTTTSVKGKAKAGAKVEFKDSNGNVVHTISELTPSQDNQPDSDGMINFTVEINPQIAVGQKVGVVVTEKAEGNKIMLPSDEVSKEVIKDADGDWQDDNAQNSDKPSIVTPVKNGDTTVEVNGKEGAKAYVVITDKNGNETKTPETTLTKGSDGKIKITVPELKDGQTIKVVQQDGDKKPVESDPVVVKPNTTGDNLENNIEKAKTKAGDESKNLDPKSSTDKELQEALKEANEAKEKANKVDQDGKQTPENTQKDVDDANERLQKALEEKDKYDKAKQAVEDAKAEWNKIKDKPAKEGDLVPTEQEYKAVKDKIDAAQKAIDDLNDKNGTADNTDKPALQKELDKIYLDKVIKQGDEKLKEPGLDPTEKDKLQKAVAEGKKTQANLNDGDANNDPDHKKISKDIKAIEDALNPKEKTKAPTIDNAIIGGTKITGTAPANSVVTVKLGDTVLGKVDADEKGKWSISTEALKEGQIVKAQAQETNKTPSDEVTKTVGLDTSKLKESIAEAERIGGVDGKNLDENNSYDKKLKDALKTAKEQAKLGDENKTTQDAIDQAKKDLDNAINKKDADEKVKVVEDKVKAGNKPTPDEIKEAQEAIDKIDGSKTLGDKDFDQDKKDLQDRLDKAKALDELKDAKGALDKAIDKAEEEKKPKDETDKAKKESKKADEIIKDGGSGKTAEDLVKEVENIKEITKKLGQPAIQITIDSAINNSGDLILTTNPGRCKVNIIIYYANGGEKKYEETTNPNGVASIKLEKPLQVDDFIEVTATKKLKPDDESDYLDNSTSTIVY